MFGYQNNFNGSSFDFQSFFDNPNLKISDLFSIKQIIREVKGAGETFQKLLLKKPYIIKQLIDIALRPEEIGVDDVQHSYIACQIIAAQGQLVQNYILGIQNIQEIDQQQQIPIQEEKEKKDQGKLFLYLYNILNTGKELNRTAAGYLLRIFSQLHYHSPQKTFEEFVNNRQLLMKCIRNLDNPSITQILVRVVCSYGQQIIRSPHKVMLANAIFQYPFSLEYKQLPDQILENVLYLVQELVQKSQQFSYYILESMISQKTLDLIHKSVQIHKQQPKILQQISQILSSLCELYIKQQVKENKKTKHFGDVDEQNENKQVRVLSDILLSKLSQIAISIFNYSKKGNCIFSCKLMADISRIHCNKQYFFLTKQLFESYKQLFQKYLYNNILHNEIKKIIILAVRSKHNQFLGQVIEYINDNHQSKKQLSNQFYHIAVAINEQDVRKQYYNSWENIKQWRQKTRILYSTVIPSPVVYQKKQRQLDDFFVNQQEIYSQQDISSEGMSPTHNKEVEQQMPDILIYSDDQSQRNLKKKQKDQGGMFVVKNAQNTDQILQNMTDEKQPNNIQSKIQELKQNFKTNEKVQDLSGQRQKKEENKQLQQISPNTFWKNVLYYTLQSVMKDLETI